MKKILIVLLVCPLPAAWANVPLTTESEQVSAVQKYSDFITSSPVQLAGFWDWLRGADDELPPDPSPEPQPAPKSRRDRLLEKYCRPASDQFEDCICDMVTNGASVDGAYEVCKKYE